jgi:SOS-response transcriptional repressor LexA
VSVAAPDRGRLSARQKATLDGMRSYQEQHGYFPSRAKLAKYLGVEETGYLQRMIQLLRDRGHIPPVMQSKRATWWDGVRAEIEHNAAEQGIAVPPALLDIIQSAIDGDMN